MSRLITEPNSLYKKCHFSERRSSSRTESLKQAVGEDGAEQEERQRTNLSFSISVSRNVSGFRNSELKSTPFELEKKRLRQWAFFFQRKLFSSSFSSDSRDCISPLFHSSILPSFPLTGFHLYTSVEPLGCLRFFFFFSFSVLQWACTKKNKSESSP